MQRRRALHLAWSAAVLAQLRPAAAQTAPPPAAATTVLLIRHALTDPGVGDPPEFKLGECGTQRNLSDEGRAQAGRLGALLSQRGLTPQRVRSSAWCRCLDTARLAFGTAEPWDALNSLFDGSPGTPHGNTSQLKAEIATLPAGRIEAWVTHQVNISDFAGQSVSMGELLVLQIGPEGAPRVVQRLRS